MMHLALMADVDHFGMTSSHSDHFDPYAKRRAFLTVSCMSRIQQRLMSNAGHRRIQREGSHLAQFIAEGPCQARGCANQFGIELSSKERDPNGHKVLQITESVAFWSQISIQAFNICNLRT